MSSSLVALLPVRSFRSGKVRLTSAVDDEARAELIRRMLTHVLAAVAEAEVFQEIAVISADPDVLAWLDINLPEVTGLRQSELTPGLIAALDQGRRWALGQGHTALAILFADLPVIASEDVRTLVATPGPVVLAPDQLGTGTNSLLLRSEGFDITSFAFQFGPGSFEAHLAEAGRLNIAPAIVTLAGLAFDLDTPADLAQLQRTPGESVITSGRTAL